jgi:insertion element IS1 protein InsB
MNKTTCNHPQFIKYGFSKNQQRYKCKQCSKTYLTNYTYNAYKENINHTIAILTKESCGIRSISRILHISKTTIIKKIKTIASTLTQPIITQHKFFEVDELRTYVKSKTSLQWVVLAYEQQSKQVVAINIGSRTNKTLRQVLQTVVNAKPIKIYTDGLSNYKYLLPPTLHSVKQFGTNRIERVNLNLRTHLKRLGRRTICFSKSATMLLACIKIYFWY